MKKISLVLCFALLMVAMLALGVFAATSENIADDARIELHDSNKTYADEKALIDGDYSTACSAGDGPESWINYRFHYDADKFPNGVTVSSVRVIIDSVGTNSNVGEVTSLQNHNYTIHLRLKDVNGNSYFNQKWNSITGEVIKTQTDENGTVLYRYLEYVFEEPVAGVYQVEVPVENGKNKNVCVWEVEIYNYVCEEYDDHKLSDATCAAPATCAYCKKTVGGVSENHTGTWSEATCKTPSTCSVCGATQGEVTTDHVWIAATCVSAKKCSVCEKIEGEVDSNAHSWKNASYDAPATCRNCGITTGDAWTDSTLTNYVKGDEGDVIKYEDIVGEVTVIAGQTTKFHESYVLDGDYSTSWGSARTPNTSIKIVFKNEWEITGVKAMIAGNYCQLKVEFFAADGTSLGSKTQTINGNYGPENSWLYGGCDTSTGVYTDYYDAVKNIDYTKKAVKYVIISNVNQYDKWGYLPLVYEFVFTGSERIPTACEEHDFGEAVVVQDPTCTEVGYTQRTCKVCNVAEGKKVISKLGHTFTEYKTLREATCTVAPKIEFTCTRCNENVVYDPTIGDVMGAIDLPGIEFTGGGGWNPYNYAMLDGNLDTRVMVGGGWYAQSIASLNESYYISSLTVWVGNEGYDDHGSNSAWLIFWYKAPGSDEWIEAGRRMTPATYKDTKYEYVLELEEPVYASEIRVFVGSPTGEYDAQGPGLSSFNGVVYDVNILGALYSTVASGHNWVAGETVAPGCYDFGYTKYTCADCGATKNDDIVRETGHSWVAATCTAPKTCSGCGATEGEALGHDLVAGETFEPDCESNGYTVYECSRCDYSENKDETAALGHNLVAGTVVPPDCTTAGYTVYNCSRCDYTENKDATESTGHSYGEVVTAPTCTTEGYTTHTCTKCGDTYTDNNTAATGHAYEVTERVEAKPGEAGYIKETCTNCGDVKTTEIEALPEHTHTEEIIPAVLPTPSVTGYTAGVKCSECGETIVAPVAVEVLVTPNYNVFGISTANIAVNENIAVNYKNIVPAEYKNAYMVFVFEGQEFIVTEYKTVGGLLTFQMAETRPQKMTYNINAYLYAEKDGVFYYDNIPEYSIQKYCENQFKNRPDDTKLLTAVSDLLVFGATVQKYVNSNISDAELVTTLVSQKYTLTPTAYTGVAPQEVKAGISGVEPEGTLWQSVSLTMGSTTEVVFKFTSTDISGLSIKIEIEGYDDVIFAAEDLKKVNGMYEARVDYLISTDYSKKVTATFIKDGVESGSAFSSVNTYLERNVDKYTGVMQEMMKALYVYGESIRAYAGLK